MKNLLTNIISLLNLHLQSVRLTHLKTEITANKVMGKGISLCTIQFTSH